ncbi:hypothetical protein [Elizabethkingia meningoseptica]|uniref:hypothetical protein n=1 Tax=Elizabethkingia meningoseptica TaxID=238 RepID=UPI0020134791|nr:hypothetical protein [Elizabethkingia meningoseptica]MCL1675607.1 hypothetical protein [Elizabethkingia meningoseptica]
MKIYYFLFLLSFSLFYSQNTKVMRIRDAVDGKPLTHARISFDNEIFYTNDDGKVLIPDNAGNIEVYAGNYQQIVLKNYTSIVKLKPRVREIREVQIRNYSNVASLIKTVYKNYNKLYYTKPSVYEAVYKQKNTRNGDMSMLVVADVGFWSLDNRYHPVYVRRKDYDSFIQLSLNRIKYFKSIEDNTSFNGSSLDSSKDFIGDMFFDFTLGKLDKFVRMKDSKIDGKILDEDDDIITISFKMFSPKYKVTNSGYFTYNKKDKVITHYEMNYDQNEVSPFRTKNEANEDYHYMTTNGEVIFDFYKVGGKYVPSYAHASGEYYMFYDDKKHEGTFDREITFRKFFASARKGLANKIDFDKKLWKNIPVDETKETRVLLSEEEQRFIDRK